MLYSCSIRAGENQFLNLAPVGLVGREEALACELLRDRAAALRQAAAPDVGQHRGADPHGVEAVVIVEALVFDRENGRLQVRRDLRERDIDALFLEDRECELVVAIENRRRLVHLAQTPQGVDVRKTAAQRDKKPPTDGQRHQDRGH